MNKPTIDTPQMETFNPESFKTSTENDMSDVDVNYRADTQSIDNMETEKKPSIEKNIAEMFRKKNTIERLYEEEKQKVLRDKLASLSNSGNGVRHAKLDEILYILKTIGTTFLVGPTGTGKSTLAKQVCTELFELGDKDPITSGKYAQISFSPDTTSGEMIGRSDVNGNFHESEIVRVFRDGGVILFDEIDDADASMLIKVNTALANGYLSTPNGMVRRNKDTYIVCAANTFGTGPDAMYVGRTRLDAATLDRFCLATVYVDYDTALESTIASVLPPQQYAWLTEYVKKVRKAISDNHMRRACSTRFVINATAHMLGGKSSAWVMENYLQGWTISERAKIKG